MRYIPILLLGTVLCAQDKELRIPFQRFDRDKDGVLQKEEFPGNADVFAAMDTDRDRKVTFDEYKVSEVARLYLAASRIDRGEARRRVGPEELAIRRLQNIDRFDPNGDGKITEKEWTGATGAFLTLDLDQNGVIDKKDRTRAESLTQAVAASRGTMPNVRDRLPGVARVLEYYDKNKDSTIDEREVRGSPVARYFSYADTDVDEVLTRSELNALVRQVNALVDARNKGNAVLRAPIIPFRSWDKDKDGRVDLKEWVNRKYLFKLMDANRDAAVTELEVLRYKRAFEGRNFLEKFDLDGNGRVNREEFNGTKAAFDRADRNGDGVISRNDR